MAGVQVPSEAGEGGGSGAVLSAGGRAGGKALVAGLLPRVAPSYRALGFCLLPTGPDGGEAVRLPEWGHLPTSKQPLPNLPSPLQGAQGGAVKGTGSPRSPTSSRPLLRRPLAPWLAAGVPLPAHAALLPACPGPPSAAPRHTAGPQAQSSADPLGRSLNACSLI